MKIVVVGQVFNYLDRECTSYLHSMVTALTKRGHEVNVFPIRKEDEIDWKSYDYCFNIDSGRDKQGRGSFLAAKCPIPSAVYFIDSHGQPSFHKRAAPNYDHVFFAVWSKRDLFTKHPSAHWCPNFTDFNHFDGSKWLFAPEYDFGFFGSKGGLPRADTMIEICKEEDWSYNVKQVGVPWKHRWPQTQEEMMNCEILFNHGQKHDGPNLRVMESMAMGRPLITDVDSKDGMSKLFEDGVHYFGYDAYTYTGLQTAMRVAKSYPAEAKRIANAAYLEVKENHQVGNRIEQMLEVVS